MEKESSKIMAYPDNYIIYTLLFIAGGFFGFYIHETFLKKWLENKIDKEKWKHR